MKLKSLILIAFVAIITLSFSFATSSRSDIHENDTIEVVEPLRGIISEDKF
jgi:hypothetical protein